MGRSVDERETNLNKRNELARWEYSTKLSQVFNIITSDNGSEFAELLHIENDTSTNDITLRILTVLWKEKEEEL